MVSNSFNLKSSDNEFFVFSIEVDKLAILDTNELTFCNSSLEIIPFAISSLEAIDAN